MVCVSPVLLQLHRSFFTRALSGPEEAFNRRHKYAPSVVAVFLSASRMIATVQDLYQREPQLTARILGYWSNAFSAAVSVFFAESPSGSWSLGELTEDFFISFPGGPLFVGFEGTVYVSFARGSPGTGEGTDAFQARKGHVYSCQSSDRRCHSTISVSTLRP